MFERSAAAGSGRNLLDRGSRWTVGFLCAGLAACALPPSDDDGVSPDSRLAFGDDWAVAMKDTGRFPVVPPSEDVYVGDVFALAEPPSFDPDQAAGRLRIAATPRWRSLDLLSRLEQEYEQRPAWYDDRSPGGAATDESLYRADRSPVRHRIVDLRSVTQLRLEGSDLQPLVPTEVTRLLGRGTTPGGFSVSVQAGEAETYSLAVESAVEQLLEPADDGAQPALKPEHLRNLPLAADPDTGRAYLAVVTEVLYVRSIEASVRGWREASAGPPAGDAREPDAAEPGRAARDGEDPELAAVRRAAELNAALARSGAGDRIDGSIELVTVTDDGLTLRRRWAHPLAVAVRGVTLEVDVSTGEVLRTAPLGIELPAFAAVERVEEEEEEESEVLEERRRGAGERARRSLEELRKTRLYWDYGPRLDTLGGDLSLVLGGRLQVDAATFGEDDEIEAAFGEPDPGLSVRRAFLETGGVYRQFDFNLWLNFTDVDLLSEGNADFSYVDFRNVFVGMREIPIVGSARVGYFKEPFGLEEITSSNDITFMERSLTDAFIERRNLGVMFQRRFTENRRMTAALGFFRNANSNLEASDGHGVTGRVTGAPTLSEDGRRVLHVGASATYRVPDSNGLRFSSRPESAQAQTLADTGTFLPDRDLRVGLELGAVLGSLSLQSETIVASASGGSGADEGTFWSTYVMGSYVLTGEHRSYRERVGAFGGVHPENLIWRGAVEAAARYSYLDLDSGRIEGGRLHDWTLGLNWYANRNLRVMLNYIVAHPEGFGFEHIVQARLQLTL